MLILLHTRVVGAPVSSAAPQPPLQLLMALPTSQSGLGSEPLPAATPLAIPSTAPRRKPLSQPPAQQTNLAPLKAAVVTMVHGAPLPSKVEASTKPLHTVGQQPTDTKHAHLKAYATTYLGVPHDASVNDEVGEFSAQVSSSSVSNHIGNQPRWQDTLPSKVKLLK